MKTKITILSFAFIALMMTSIGCKKETPVPTPTPAPTTSTWTVEYSIAHLNAGTFNLTYIQNGVTYTVNNVQNGWTTSFIGKTGDYCSVSCSMPYVNNNDACLTIKYNGTILNNDCKNYPSTSVSASGTLP